MTHIHITYHALARARERGFPNLTGTDLENIVQDSKSYVGVTPNGDLFYAAENLVLLARRQRGKIIVITALSPDWAIENILPVESPQEDDFNGHKAWQRDQAHLFGYAEKIRVLTKPLPILPIPTAPVICVKQRVPLTNVSAAFFREARLLLGISQQELAAKVGVLRATIKRLECNELRTLDADVASKIRSVLQVQA